MEAFVFAQGLGVRGPGMTEGNAQADEPDGKGVGVGIALAKPISE